MSTFSYIKNFLKDRDVASVTPTSRFAIRKVCSPMRFDHDLTVVEYGAGAGVFADFLLPKMTPESRLVLFETNSGLFQKLKEREDPRLILHNESVEIVDRVLDPSLAGKVDYIISGVPFSFFSDADTLDILRRSRGLLRPGGWFLAYQTSDHLKKPLEEIFGDVETEFEILNIPPMLIYRSRGPETKGA
ncbi:MAG: methyltransferase domain-containing protein [Balneolaceae bacterium]|nr:methyltransferase domain-containing protein [Balneolaceae bacterium]